MSLAGKAAVVIGASRGMGKQMALLLAKEGADIVVSARTERSDDSPWPGTIYEAAEEIRALGRRALPIKADLTAPNEVEDMCRKAIESFGRVDIFIISVQYMGPGYLSTFLDTTVEQWNAQVAVNLTGAFRACKVLVPEMIKQGGGIVICVTSSAAWRENPNTPGKGSTGLGYPSTKAGLNRFVVGLAKEVKQHNIAVIALDPGHTLSEHVDVGTVGHDYHGWDTRRAHSMDVPAKTAWYLCTCPNPMWYTGKVVVAEEFAQEHNIPVEPVTWTPKYT